MRLVLVAAVPMVGHRRPMGTWMASQTTPALERGAGVAAAPSDVAATRCNRDREVTARQLHLSHEPKRHFRDGTLASLKILANDRIMPAILCLSC